MGLFSFNKGRGISSEYRPINELEQKLIELWKVPERNWYKGRMRKAFEILATYVSGDEVQEIEKLLEPNHYLMAQRFDYQEQTYVMFFDITFNDPSKTVPTFNWFQLERQDKTLGELVNKTILLLSSDNNAKTQGGWVLLLFEKQ